MEAPPYLLDREPGAQIAVAVGGPVVAGIICGLILGWNGTAYTIATLLLVLGGIAGGYEHPNADEGAVRGLCSGLIFGTMIVATSAVSGVDPQASLPHPPGFLPLVTGIITLCLGAFGGWLRGRHDRKQQPRQPSRAAT
jgi:hypothetical protein